MVAIVRTHQHAQKTALNSTEYERTKALADVMCLPLVVINIFSSFLVVICVKVSCNCFHSQGRPGSKMQKAPNKDKDKRKDSAKGKDKVCGSMYLNAPQDVVKNRI